MSKFKRHPYIRLITPIILSAIVAMMRGKIVF